MDALLKKHWGIAGARLTRAERGHTNQSFFVGERWVLRRSWPGKLIDQVRREELLLTALPREAKAPRLIATLDGELRVEVAGCFVHLFERLPGAPAQSDAAPALTHLKVLHAALSKISGGESHPLEWLRERHAGVAARGGARLPSWVELHRVLSRVEKILATTIDGRGQWLHGDYHLGNLLVEEDELVGVVDFDDCGRGSPAIETAFARFALERDPNAEEHVLSGDPLEALFCADQVLIHLAAAQRGLWALGPGIGFLACWRALVNAA